MSVDSENWELLQNLFHLAAETPESEREKVLTAACPDPHLRRRAMAILNSGDFESEPQTEHAPTTLTGKIGPYNLIRLLGSGGIGSVYLVERVVSGAVLRSAMKVLAPHAAGPSFVERFQREQQILATLDHPNITRMLDAGVETRLDSNLSEAGQPYLVMEYVEGTHLDAYCDSHKLTIAERLALFLHVCDAVAYAHKNLVVHLDLKPSNILINSEGIVKLLDFGTSKLLQSDSLFTTTVMATPAYASPEQLRNDPVTTACDIYSLGAILFELLSGRRLGGKASVAAMMERAITEREPEALTENITPEAAEARGLTQPRLRQALNGDLATIVQKCLRPHPKDRYGSLDALGEDIRRYLEGMPVLARRQTSLYRLNKFIRRNRSTVAAAALIAIALLSSLIYAEWRQRQAIREGQRAVRMQTFLYRLLYLANSNYTGKPTFTVPDFLELGVKLLPDYIKDPADLRKAQMSLAESMYENNDLENAQKVFMQVIASAKAAGDIDTEAESEGTCGDAAYLQGETQLGLELTTHALELSRKRGISPAVRLWSKVYYASNRDRLGFITDENLELLRQAATEARGRDVLPRREVADVLYTYAWDLKRRDRFNDAEPLYKEALAIYMQDAQAKCDQSAVLGELAYLKDASGDVASSIPMYKQAYEGYKACSGPDSRGALEQQDRMAGAMIKLGQAQQALPMLVQALPAWRRIAGSSPDMAEPLSYLTRAYLETKHFKDAEQSAKEFYDVQAGKVSPTDRRLGEAQFIWAKALANEGKEREALPHAELAAKLLIQGKTIDAQRMDAAAHQLLQSLQTTQNGAQHAIDSKAIRPGKGI